ncbi:cytoplasmic tRNA 2-thiolation protein 2-like isoform X3 [Daktulosphaira vitifoliae]|uniref:cytoplasmic tRNA 2-thiolation protein 2-like isoform X3 n=1 Tax=Daktulosphaira vitifoliae TaxID=58002 RepID=UPI0021AA8561|nr:cytoplasmic tRNA 2-thiolation protein 2-like isoform X3 [Daktulosphaira vitifoliae]
MMCSLNDGCNKIFKDSNTKDALIINVNNSKCRKCLIQDGHVVLRKKDVYCKDCFIPMVIHKFRATLGKSKLVKQGENVMICVSGSQCSISLLHLIWSGLQQTTHKRLTFTPVVLHIDETVLFGYSKERFIQFKELFESYNLPYYIISFSSALYSENVLDEDCYLQKYDKKLKSLFNSKFDLTLKQDILIRLRKLAIIRIARALNCTRVMTAENEQKLSIKLLSNVALGRGSQIGNEIGLAINNKSINTSIVFLRPLRDLSAKEVSFYALFNQLNDLEHPNFLTKTNEDESIQKISEQFINSLQEEFPSTISTIFRTGEKIVEKTTIDNTCVICNGIMDTDMPLSSSVEATRFSKYVSQMGVNAVEANLNDLNLKKKLRESCCNEDCNCSNEKFTKQDIINCLCYGCQHIDSVDDLPDEIIKICKENLADKSMKKQIKDFLL